ncbi:barstar family protein [Paenibacillus sp. OAS669]|uniref:barstar family protein n=1 Tax=Paenibacillus sp. OAS669 TaxID=2663821 RepID=UPI00178C00EF|nr:barstar family protein [Paenibacillus sp. OAS669]MBE1441250.1 RNAse (barnase) inhibitor barstar [Paenibacillus sp. OAS669]
MNNKFSIIDDESGLTIGSCNDIAGLTGDEFIVINDESLNRITLLNFQFSEIFKKEWLGKKYYIGNLQLTILNNSGVNIGAYYFGLDEAVSCRKIGFWEGQHTRLAGTLLYAASREAMVLWDEWRTAQPDQYNMWVNLTSSERLGWLEVIRLFNDFCSSSNNSNNKQDKSGEIYHLDGLHIKDRTSFFCALGEAVNGPGGYFGVCLDSLSDCLCGGFGARPPFTIHWNHADVFINDEHDDQRDNAKHGNRAYLISLLEVFNRHNIPVIFSS